MYQGLRTPIGENEIDALRNVANKTFERDFVVGVSVQILGCLLVAAGLCVEKYAIVHIERASQKKRCLSEKKKANESSENAGYSVWTNHVYLFGFFMFLCGNVCSAIALSYAAAAVLAPLSCLNIIANVFFSAMLLQEKVSRNDISSTCVIMLGAIMVVYFSDHSNKRLSASTVTHLVTRPTSVMYVSFVTMVVAGILVSLRSSKEGVRKRRESLSEIRLLIPIADSEKDTRDAERASSTSSPGDRMREQLSNLVDDVNVATPFHLVASFATLSAIFGAGSFMSAKVMSTMLANMSDGLDTTTSALWLLVPSVVLVAIFASLQVHWMNEALQACDCLRVVPMYYAMAILLQSLSGAVMFNEFATYDVVQSVAFAMGTAILIYGVYRLSAGHVDKKTGTVSELDAQTKREADRLAKDQSTESKWNRVKTGVRTMGVVRRRLESVRRLRAASSRRLTLGVA